MRRKAVVSSFIQLQGLLGHVWENAIKISQEFITTAHTLNTYVSTLVNSIVIELRLTLSLGFMFYNFCDSILKFSVSW